MNIDIMHIKDKEKSGHWALAPMWLVVMLSCRRVLEGMISGPTVLILNPSGN